MTQLREFKAIARYYIEPWMTERIQSTNFDLVNTMHQCLLAVPSLALLFQVTRDQLAQLKDNRRALDNLLFTPFSMITMTLTTVEDWKCLIEGTTTTLAVDRLKANMPVLPTLTDFFISESNKRFLDMAISLIHMNVMAAPLLGISNELAQYLVTVSSHQLHVAMERVPGLPFFRFRFDTGRFWIELENDYISSESVAHQVMMTSPTLRNFSFPKDWNADFRVKKNVGEIFGDAMMAYGCRAKTVSNLFRLAAHHTRGRYMHIHGQPSKCGNQPNSLHWFVETPIKRLHASVYSWLYRYALSAGASVPQALIATSDLYEKLFREKTLVNPDRAILLTRSMSADNRLTMVPCRHCATEYILSNGDNKIEMQSSFQCPGCLLKLVDRSRKSAH